jgi:hypothetical protein
MIGLTGYWLFKSKIDDWNTSIMRECYQPISLFLGLFASKWPAELRPKEFAELLKQALPEFGLPPTFPQLPPNAPADVPRIVLLGDNKNKVLEVAPAKVNLRLNRTAGPLTLAQWLPEFRELTAKIDSQLTEHGWSFVRIGLVVTLFREVGASVNQLLRDYFFRDRSLFQPDPHEVQFNIHTRVVLAGDHLANRWIRIRPLRRSPGNEDFALQVQVDLNTLPENAATKSLQEIQDFLALAARHVEEGIGFLDDETF